MAHISQRPPLLLINCNTTTMACAVKGTVHDACMPPAAGGCKLFLFSALPTPLFQQAAQQLSQNTKHVALAANTSPHCFLKRVPRRGSTPATVHAIRCTQAALLHSGLPKPDTHFFEAHVQHPHRPGQRSSCSNPNQTKSCSKVLLEPIPSTLATSTPALLLAAHLATRAWHYCPKHHTASLATITHCSNAAAVLRTLRLTQNYNHHHQEEMAFLRPSLIANISCT